MPHIEFVKRIPTVLELDHYFDVNNGNMIVFDDQMTDGSKDKRVVNLFTRDWHHLNLSVICVVQNLFHHYLVLFKNPRDKLQIALLRSF